LRIGAIAGKAGIPVETIRYYEKIGLLPEPHRDTNGYRIYGEAHLDRLLFIRRCRNLDMAQEEIRELIRLADNPEADCRDVDALLARHLDHVRERLQELARLEQTLVQLQAACTNGGTVGECGILDGLTSELGKLESPGDDNHVPGTHGQGHGSS